MGYIYFLFETGCPDNSAKPVDKFGKNRANNGAIKGEAKKSETELQDRCYFFTR